MTRVTFIWSESIAEATAAAFAEQKARIRERLADAEICHTGGTSAPGLLTSGDVDVHVRVSKQMFAGACEVLGELYEPQHPTAWHTEAAFFVAPRSQPLVEVALTVIGSLDDLHHGGAWRQIGASEELRGRYNTLTRDHEGGPAEEYHTAKRAFFSDSFQLQPDEPSTELPSRSRPLERSEGRGADQPRGGR